MKSDKKYMCKVLSGTEKELNEFKKWLKTVGNKQDYEQFIIPVPLCGNPASSLPLKLNKTC